MALPGETAPLLSVVVTIVGAGEVVARFLDAMLSQEDPPTMEILVPYDASIAETAALREAYPAVHFLDLGAVPTARPAASAAGQHELYDRRRAAGLRAARGELVAILEDRAPPRRGWARAMVRLHREHPYGVIGGAIECAPGDLLNWAFYACDFGRYGLPFESGARSWISDVNVCYKRRALEETRQIWAERFSEPSVHWALLARGETLFLASEAVVDYGTPYDSLAGVLPERFHWGRLFGFLRASHVGRLRRAGYVAVGPFIPLVLFLRHGLMQSRKQRLGRFLRAAPIMLTLLIAWTSGEVWGYLTKRP